MPIHDWTRVDDSLFHNFQLSWIVELARRLNHGFLPSSHFALTETIDHRSNPGLPVMPEPERPHADSGLVGDVRSVRDELPPVRWVFSTDEVEYATRAVTIRDADSHQVRAAILVVCGQDKRTAARLEKFAERAAAALSHDIHLLVVDLFPPNVKNPHGIHRAIWDHIQPTPYQLPRTNR